LLQIFYYTQGRTHRRNAIACSRAFPRPTL